MQLKRTILTNDKNVLTKVALINSAWFEKWKKISCYEAIKDELNMCLYINDNRNNLMGTYLEMKDNLSIKENIDKNINNSFIISGYDDLGKRYNVNPYANFELISQDLWNCFVPPNTSNINHGTLVELDLEFLTKKSLIIHLDQTSCYIIFWNINDQKLNKIILIFSSLEEKIKALENLKSLGINNFYTCYLSDLEEYKNVDDALSFCCINKSEKKIKNENEFREFNTKNQNCFKLRNNNSLNNDFSKEYLTKIKILENKLIEQININKDQKDLILKLQNNLNNANNIKNLNQNFIMNLQDKISQKENEIMMLKKEMEEHKNKVNNQNKIININNLMSANFISTDGVLHYSIPCESSDIFAEIEEKLYKKYPEYRETNNIFLYNGKSILRFKTLAENKIENGMPITLNNIVE